MVLTPSPGVVEADVVLTVKSGTAAHTGVWFGSESMTHIWVTHWGVSAAEKGTLHWAIWFEIHARCPGVHGSLVLSDWKARFNRCASNADASIGPTVPTGIEEVLVLVEGMVDTLCTVPFMLVDPLA